MQSYWLIILAILVGAYIALNRFRRTEKGTYIIDSLILRSPVFGPLLKKVAVAKFTGQWQR